MKMESPLDVLSRAVSMVQSEDKTEKNYGSATDSGFEDDHSISRSSPKCSNPSPPPIGKNKLQSSSVHSDDAEESSHSQKAISPKRSLPSPITNAKKIKLANSTPNCSDSPCGRSWFQFGKGPFHAVDSKERNAVTPPPLIAFSEKPKFATSLPIYGSFLSRPSVISTSTPMTKYTEKCSISNCSCTQVTSCSTFQPAYTSINKNSIPNGFELPTVDDHFRKSLGDIYDSSKSHNLNERPSSVDEHFAKALGNSWYRIEYGKCKSS